MSSEVKQGFPNLGSPFVVEGGQISQPWYRLLLALWKKTGGSVVPITQLLYLQQTSTGDVDIYNTNTNEKLGRLRLANTPGKPAVNIIVLGSPFAYSAIEDGTLVVFAAKIELSRLGGPFVQVSLQGGAVPMLASDIVRLTWFSAEPPIVTWLPD